MGACSAPSHVTAVRDLLHLTSRLLAEEIDADLYRALLAADRGASAGPVDDPLVDDEIQSLEEHRALEELSVEFCRLFIGPRPVCPPYESVYRGEATMGGRAEHRVREFLKRHSMEAVLPTAVPVLSHDHLAVELTVLAHLCINSADQLYPFMESHLLPWAPAYLRELHSAARLAPYRTIADITGRLLTSWTVGQVRANTEEKKSLQP